MLILLLVLPWVVQVKIAKYKARDWSQKQISNYKRIQMSDHLRIFGPNQDINIDKVKGGGKANFSPAHKKQRTPNCLEHMVAKMMCLAQQGYRGACHKLSISIF